MENATLKYDYTLKVGKKGSERLMLLNQLINPHSINFINSAIELKNQRILEVGCGAAIITAELARESLPNGNVLATDVSIEQLALAKKNAKKLGVENIQFKRMSVFSIDQLNQNFDLIYFRFVLGHLPHTLEILQKITRLMHADSVLICEEIENVETMFCDPPDPTFKWWLRALDIQMQAGKGDFIIGKRLEDLFKQANLTTTLTKSVQPIMISSKLKHQLWMGIIEISPILITSGFSTQRQIEQMIVELKNLADDPLTTIGFFHLKQIAAKKAEVCELKEGGRNQEIPMKPR